MKTKHVMFRPTGVCSQVIDVTADENDVIQQVFFIGGCNGNRRASVAAQSARPAPTNSAKPLRNWRVHHWNNK